MPASSSPTASGRRQPVTRLLGALTLLALVGGASAAQQAIRITLPNASDSVKFLAMGDSGTGERPQYEVAARMAEARRLFAFDFAIMLGDNLYGSHAAGDFVTKFERPYRPLLDAGVRFYASLGNHDTPASRDYPLWNMGGGAYYTYVKNNVRFFSLDSNTIDRAEIGWLTAQLEASTEQWKVAYFHHPLYSSAGRHGSDRDNRSRLEPLFVKYGINAVFSGHDHVYERLRPQNGIYYFVTGSAGQLRRHNLQPSAMTAVGFDDDQAFLLVEIDGDSMSIQAISRTGRTVDSATLPRQAGPNGAGTARH